MNLRTGPLPHQTTLPLNMDPNDTYKIANAAVCAVLKNEHFAWLEAIWFFSFILLCGGWHSFPTWIFGMCGEFQNVERPTLPDAVSCFALLSFRPAWVPCWTGEAQERMLHILRSLLTTTAWWERGQGLVQQCRNEMQPAQIAAGKSSKVTASAVNEEAFHTATTHDRTMIHSFSGIPQYICAVLQRWQKHTHSSLK